MRKWIPILFLLIFIAVIVLAYIDIAAPQTSSSTTTSPSQDSTDAPHRIIERELDPRNERAEVIEPIALETLEAESEKEESWNANADQKAIFESFKSILRESFPSLEKREIYLNTPMRQLLDTPQKRAYFEKVLQKRFKMSVEQSKEAMEKNRIVWDWVHTFSAR